MRTKPASCIAALYPLFFDVGRAGRTFYVWKTPHCAMERLNIRETWRYLKDYTGFTWTKKPPEEGGNLGVSYYRVEHVNPLFEDGEEEDLWRFENLTMPNCFFERCGIYRVSFRNSFLSDSWFCCNDFANVDFTDADLSSCDMRCSIFDYVAFERANLRAADLRRSSFKKCNFTDADMLGTKMMRSQAKGLSLSERQYQEISWQRRQGDGNPCRG